MHKTYLEKAREELEILLNTEISPTEAVRKEDVRFWHFPFAENWADRPVSDGELQKTEYQMKSFGSLIYVRTTEPYFVAEGSRQIVLAVGNGLVAKTASLLPDSVREKARKFAADKSGIGRSEMIERNFSGVYDKRSAAYNNAFAEKMGQNVCRMLGSKTFEHLSGTIGVFKKYGLPVVPVSLYRLVWNETDICVSSDIVTLPFGASYEIKEKHRARFPNLYLTPDLRENGRFTVLEYDEEIANSLINGKKLIEQYNSCWQKVLDFEINSNNRALRVDLTDGGRNIAVRTGKYDLIVYDRLTGQEIDLDTLPEDEHFRPRGPYLTYDYHLGDHTAMAAIKKMFLLQVPLNQKEEGKLVLGDLDHVTIWQ